MPVSLTFDERRQWVISVFHGELDDPSLRDRARKLRADPRFHERMPELVDLTAVSAVSLTSEMMKVSARSRLHASGVRCVILAVENRVFDFARAYQVLRERNGMMGLRVVRTIPEAVEWLEALDTREAAIA